MFLLHIPKRTENCESWSIKGRNCFVTYWNLTIRKIIRTDNLPYILITIKKIETFIFLVPLGNSKSFKIYATNSITFIPLHFYVFVTVSKWMPVENCTKNLNLKTFYFWSHGGNWKCFEIYVSTYLQNVSLNTFPFICNHFKIANGWSLQKKTTLKKFQLSCFFQIEFEDCRKSQNSNKSNSPISDHTAIILRNYCI